MSGPDHPISHYVIAGGGTAGWMAAAILARFLPPPTATITLVESDAIGTIGVGEATVPLLADLNALLGFHEPDFVRATQGSFKLGIEFADWGEVGNRHFHGFGDFGEDIAGVPAHHHWLRLAREHPVGALGSWSMPTVAAEADRFAPAAAFSGPAAEYKHAYQFDAGLYAAYLRRYAETRGVRRIEGRIVDVERDGGSGNVAAIRLDGDRRISGEVFIDCTGFASLLLGGAMGVPFIDWGEWLPCDRAVAVGCARAGRFTPFTRSTAHPAGWQWRIPLQHRTGNGLVYASRYLSDDEATAALLANLDAEPLADPRVLRFRPGRRERVWAGNVIGIGLAAGFLEPLESTSIQLIQTGLARLIDWLPGRSHDAALAAEYNRQTIGEWERIRDFLIAHYCLSRRPEPMWREATAMSLPDTLAHKLATWQATGKVPLYDLESHREPSWVSILVGQGVMPRRHDPAADRVPLDRLIARFDQRRAVLAQAVRAMPPHDRFVAQTCRADAA